MLKISRGETTMRAIKTILVPTDFGAAAEQALRYGRALASAFGAEIHVLHVVENVAAAVGGVPEAVIDVGSIQRDLDESADAALAALATDGDGRAVRTTMVRLTSVNPEGEILHYAREHCVDLIVMGTHGRGALAHVIAGSVAEHVVRLAPCPVLTVKHSEHESIARESLDIATTAPQG